MYKRLFGRENGGYNGDEDCSIADGKGNEDCDCDNGDYFDVHNDTKVKLSRYVVFRGK